MMPTRRKRLAAWGILGALATAAVVGGADLFRFGALSGASARFRAILRESRAAAAESGRPQRLTCPDPGKGVLRLEDSGGAVREFILGDGMGFESFPPELVFRPDGTMRHLPWAPSSPVDDSGLGRFEPIFGGDVSIRHPRLGHWVVLVLDPARGGVRESCHVRRVGAGSPE